MHRLLARRCLPLLCLLCAVSARAQNGDAANEAQPPPPADLKIPPAPVLVAEEAIKTIKVAPGYQLEIAAADPLIGNPVAMAFGPDGRLWVVEMRAFMPNPDGKGEDAKVGCVAVLEDTDHDGRFDKRTVFLDGLVLPRAFALVGDGVLVAEPPHLWFCRDTNGDGVADEKTEVASDYGSAENPEHTANGLLRAMDNWIYSANHAIRYRYLGNGKFAQEPTFSRGQWGISQDNTGRLFHNNNSDPIRYDAVPSAYFARNPALADPSGVNAQLVPADLRIWPLRVTPGVNRGYKSLDSTGRITAVTAACGPVVYRGDLLPDLRNDVFVCEPSGNLIKRIALEARDDHLAGRNVYQGEEFIASTDERFRPVNLANGPDGALYIVDMYHGIIQHRIYLTTYLRQQIESRGLADGAGMGRIYRVVPEGASKPQAPFDLTKETSAQLVLRLESHNGWWRDTAQRLLVERRDPASVPLLRALALNAKTAALARVHALWTLEGVDGLDRATLLAALHDPDERVCAAAIRLSEPLLAQGDDDLLDAVAKIHAEADAPYSVVLQQALSLGASPSPKAVQALLDLGRRHGNAARAFFAESAVSGLAGRENDFIALALGQPDPQAAAPLTQLAAVCVWRAGPAEQVSRLDSLLSGSPSLLLASLKQAIPHQSDGKLLNAHFTAAPASLVKLASSDSADGPRARELLAHLSWPGHEIETKAAPLTAGQQVLFEKGRGVFTTICAGCHQPNGQGLKGLAPSLVTSKWVAGNERALARIVLQGKLSENLIMPSLQALDDESLAGVLTFVRRSWGHPYDPVAPAVIAQARKETAGRAEPWTEKDLAKFSEANRVGEGQH